MAKLAEPLTRDFVATAVVPCLKVMEPVGVPPLWPLTVAVNVTCWLTIDGLGLDVNAVAVLARFSTCDKTLEPLLLKFVSPPYRAVIECVPIVKRDTIRLAIPPLTVPVPIVLAPSLKVTSPVGEPEVAVTIAVNVTAWR